MNKASFLSNRATAPVSMSLAIALALAMTTAANAQYTRHDGANHRHVAHHGTASAAPAAGRARSGVAPSAGQSRSNVGSRAPAKATGKPGYQYGQTGPTTITGPNGQKITLGGTQTIKGVNGKQISVGGASPLKGAHGQSYSAGVTTGPQRNAGGVNAQGDHQGGVYFNNGGMAGESQGKKTVKQFDQVTQRNKDGTYSPKPGRDSGSKDAADGKKSFVCSLTGYGCGSKSAATTKSGNSRAEQFKNQEGGGVGDDPDIGSQGGGTLVSGTGKGIHPGHRGQDGGGNGPGTDGASTGGGSSRNNATGAYVVTSKYGQDIPVKPKPTGPMINSYNGAKGVTDPKRGSGAGGG